MAAAGIPANDWTNRWRSRQLRSALRMRKSAQCTVQTMQGSNERTMCCTAAGAVSPSPTGRADQRLFSAPGLAATVARREVPGGGRDDLVVVDAAAADGQPVAERAARGFDEAGALPRPALADHAEGLAGPGPPTAPSPAAGAPPRAGGPPRGPSQWPARGATRSRSSGWPATTCRASAPVSTTSPPSRGALHQV